MLKGYPNKQSTQRRLADKQIQQLKIQSHVSLYSKSTNATPKILVPIFQHWSINVASQAGANLKYFKLRAEVMATYFRKKYAW